MRRLWNPYLTLVLVCGIAVFLFGGAADQKASAPAAPAWSMNATIVEACSCPMFCQCYFNEAPAGHQGHDGHGGLYCRFNNAFHVNKGQYGATSLDGAKFWVAGDLGGDFSKGQMDWAVLTFDPAVTKEQRDGIVAVLGKLYPVKWNSFTIAKDAPMQWQASKESALATLDGGKTAEVALGRVAGMTSDPVVIKNLKYWGAPRNDGFVLMPNTVEAYHAGDKPFEYHGTNGFMITFDISSSTI
jgi:hypothetical protein